ncbi:hypothetical protein GQ44DRAFT_729225 [Phaeosphaeriaceae sp. PMI808]|nr:hypothetical protein GQ44DRAFT_729225 [Phaeosphaeriaceae sp. PMI808]
MTNLMHGQPSLTIPPPSPMVQDVLQKLNSIGADFIWIFAVYQEQMRINKGLKDEITNVSASYELLRQTYDLAEKRITSLESLLFSSSDDESDRYTEFSSGSPTEEKVQQEEISYLREQCHRIQLEHETEVAEMAETTQKYEEALRRASDLVAASAKKIEELEARGGSQANDQSHERNESSLRTSTGSKRVVEPAEQPAKRARVTRGTGSETQPIELPETQQSQLANTIKRYSPLGLTYPKDKLPALSDIAKRVLIGREDEYLAGMWKSTLLVDLAWRVEKSCTSRLNSWRAPTWSWVPVGGLVHIPGIKKQNCCAEMIHVYCKPSSAEPTGAVLEGSLALRGQVIRSLRSAEGIPLCSYRDQLGTRSVTRIYPDFAWPRVDTSSCCLRIGTLDNGIHEIEYFLIIQATNKDRSTYERVGLLQIHRSQRVQDHSNKQEVQSEINDITRAIQESPFEVITII